MTLNLEIDDWLDVSIDDAWHALTDSRMLTRWLMPNDFEPRVGHKFTLTDPPTEHWNGKIACEVLELEAPHRMVWSWNGSTAGEETTRVTFELKSEKDRTRLTIRHQGAAPERAVQQIAAGWNAKLANFKRVLGPDYTARVAFKASRENVFDALTTLAGLRGWWTKTLHGSAEKQGDLQLAFPRADQHIDLRVAVSDKPSRVVWSCKDHSLFRDWAGTEIIFEISERDAPKSASACLLQFRHRGLTAKLPCYGDCSSGWDHFLTSLVSYVETGKGTPY